MNLGLSIIRYALIHGIACVNETPPQAPLMHSESLLKLPIAALVQRAFGHNCGRQEAKHLCFCSELQRKWYSYDTYTLVWQEKKEELRREEAERSLECKHSDRGVLK